MEKRPLALQNRIPEPEIMDDFEQVQAYAQADFRVPHEMFVDLLEERHGSDLKGLFLDLGCGPCDVTARFAKRFPDTTIHAVDASKPMLQEAERILEQRGLSQRITLFHARLPFKDTPIFKNHYDGVIVNSLLHHLPSQKLLWDTISQCVREGGIIFVMDLIRPHNTAEAKAIVEKYSGSEPEILKRDFYHSLLAAYRIPEIREYLKKTQLNHLTIEKVSDRHLIVWGKK